MARNFLSIHCRKCRRHVPSRDHERRRQYCLLPRQRQRDVVPARKRHRAIAVDRPSDYEGHEHGSALSSRTVCDRRRRRVWDESLIEDRKLSAFITIHISDHLMRLLKILALSVALLTTVPAVQQPSFHTKGTPTGKPTGPLKPGVYWWRPEL